MIQPCPIYDLAMPESELVTVNRQHNNNGSVVCGCSLQRVGGLDVIGKIGCPPMTGLDHQREKDIRKTL